MNTARIEMLEKFMKDDPTDPFPIYALALEYQVTEPCKTRQLFEQLLTTHPEYLPTYYMAGNFFLEQGEVERATGVLQLGLKLAKRLNELAALRELQSVLDNI
ncbi:MAG: tetratricopeptide repeat protein [Cytophagales bacterium]|nr:tetratricopeptide repeat protein [Cytophagales bacterium]